VRGVDLAQPIGNGIAALKVACGTAWQFDHFIDTLVKSAAGVHSRPTPRVAASRPDWYDR
jgi:hypothetical protein